LLIVVFGPTSAPADRICVVCAEVLGLFAELPGPVPVDGLVGALGDFWPAVPD
jgi:hypothetical protein